MKMLFHPCSGKPGVLLMAVMILSLGWALLTAIGDDAGLEPAVSEYDKFSDSEASLNLPPTLCQDPELPSEDKAAGCYSGETAPAGNTNLPEADAPLVPENNAGEQPVAAAEERLSVDRNVPSRGDNKQAVLMRGLASWYGGSDGLDGRRTAYGEIFDATAFTAACRDLPYQTMLKVTFLKTGKSVIVRVNDRGPVMKERLIDLSRAAAVEIGLLSYGVGLVEIEVLR